MLSHPPLAEADGLEGAEAWPASAAPPPTPAPSRGSGQAENSGFLTQYRALGARKSQEKLA